MQSDSALSTQCIPVRGLTLSPSTKSATGHLANRVGALESICAPVARPPLYFAMGVELPD
jgi:hypothetical protein